MMPVTVGSLVQPADFVLDIALCRRRGELRQRVIDADGPAGIALPLGVKLTARRCADEEGREMHGMSARSERGDSRLYLGFNAFGKCGTVNDLRAVGHRGADYMYAMGGCTRLQMGNPTRPCLSVSEDRDLSGKSIPVFADAQTRA